MAKFKQSFAFKGELEIENDEYFVVETNKEETKVYNLTSILNSMIGKDRVINISISEDNEPTAVE